MFDNAVVLDVEIAKESAHTNGHRQEDDQRGSNHGIARQAEPVFAAFPSALRDFDLNGHAFNTTPTKLPAGQTMGRAQGLDACCSLCRFPARSFHHYVMSGGDVFHCTAMPANKKKPAVHAGL